MTSESNLIARVCESLGRYRADGADTFEADGALFIRNPAAPRHHDTNNVSLIRSRDLAEVESLLARAEQVYEELDHICFRADVLTPPVFEARMQFEQGFKRDSSLVLLLEGELNARHVEADIREVLADEDWHAFNELWKLDWQDYMKSAGFVADGDEIAAILTGKRLKSPPERTWMAYVDGVPRAFFSSWAADGIGRVEDLFTHPDFRHRGLATALIRHCVSDARERGAREVIITASSEDTPKQMYRDMGFRPFMIEYSYLRMKKPKRGD